MALRNPARLKRINSVFHTTSAELPVWRLLLSLPAGSYYFVLQNGKAIPLNRTGNWDYPMRAELKVTAQGSKIEIIQLAP